MSNKKDKVEKKNTNVSLNSELKKQLKIYAALHNTNLSAILNRAGQIYLSGVNA